MGWLWTALVISVVCGNTFWCTWACKLGSLAWLWNERIRSNYLPHETVLCSTRAPTASVHSKSKCGGVRRWKASTLLSYSMEKHLMGEAKIDILKCLLHYSCSAFWERSQQIKFVKHIVGKTFSGRKGSLGAHSIHTHGQDRLIWTTARRH